MNVTLLLLFVITTTLSKFWGKKLKGKRANLIPAQNAIINIMKVPEWATNFHGAFDSQKFLAIQKARPTPPTEPKLPPKKGSFSENLYIKNWKTCHVASFLNGKLVDGFNLFEKY